MNVDTGELVTLARLHDMFGDQIPAAFKPVPDELIADAHKELGEKSSTVVDMNKDTPLVNWAKSMQAKKKNVRKIRRKMACKSRSINQRGAK